MLFILPIQLKIPYTQAGHLDLRIILVVLHKEVLRFDVAMYEVVLVEIAWTVPF
jgi:hypothetical protein